MFPYLGGREMRGMARSWGRPGTMAYYYNYFKRHYTSLPSSSSPAVEVATVSIFWDLDNKPPECVQPYDAATRLRQMAQELGRVQDALACANRHAFSYLPKWVREERRSRFSLDYLETLYPDPLLGQPYICSYCGRKCTTHAALKKHFQQLHKRERAKRFARLDSLKPGSKRRRRCKEALFSSDRENRYQEAVRGLILPKSGYGLAGDLRRAGFKVRTVSDRPQAADKALQSAILTSIWNGLHCVCLVSDDSNFQDVLRTAQEHNLRTVVVGDSGNRALRKHSDMYFSWRDIASGDAFRNTNEASNLWYGQEGPWHADNAFHQVQYPISNDIESLVSKEDDDIYENDKEVFDDVFIEAPSRRQHNSTLNWWVEHEADCNE